MLSSRSESGQLEYSQHSGFSFNDHLPDIISSITSDLVSDDMDIVNLDQILESLYFNEDLVSFDHDGFEQQGMYFTDETDPFTVENVEPIQTGSSSNDVSVDDISSEMCNHLYRVLIIPDEEDI